MWFSTDTQRTHYEIIGQGFPLVMLHGWGCDWQIWAPVIGKLSEKFQLIIPDLPAFGKSELNNEVWTSQEYVNWLDEFIQETVGTKKYFLLGHSFGGKIASLFVTHHQPKNLQHLIVVDSAGIPGTLTFSQEFTQTFFSFFPTFLKESLSSEHKAKVLTKFGISTDHLLSNPQQKRILRTTVREDIRPQLEKITVPTTIVWGEKDQETPVENAHEFHKLISKSKLEIFPNTDHFPFIQHPQKFSSIIEQLL